jgi:2-keto-4-pentenoate hydratase/2-oxohepta-3-ene-1,7-dioic acid hydratase in catechol pathway
MKIIRYLSETNEVKYASLQADGTAIEITGNLYSGLRETNQTANIQKYLAPLEPTQILGIGLNYKQHAQESGMNPPQYPVLFSKGLNTVIGNGEPILIPQHSKSDKVDYECELAVVIGKAGKNIAKENALEYVLGYTCANDVSARDWQIEKGGGQWSRGKFFDTFCPLGPVLVTKDDIPNPNALGIKTILNGQVVQDWNTNDMIFDVPSLISFLSGSTTLLPGTVILTGTPHGVGMAQKPPRWLQAGDEVTIEIEGIGQLTNTVGLET